MINFLKNSATIIAVILLFLLTRLIPNEEEQHILFTAEAGGEGACIDYDQTENIINVNCNASFLDVIQTINDPRILKSLGNGEYLLNSSLELADAVTFEMSSSSGGDNLQYLKIAGANGIIVHGKILIEGVKITSWNASSNDVIQQDRNGTIHRGYVQFAASEGSQIINSEFAYLGDVQPGRRGI